MSEARRLRCLWAETKEETNFLVSNFKSFRSELKSTSASSSISSGSASMIWISSGLASACLIALCLMLAVSGIIATGFTLTYLLIYFKFYPTFRKVLRRKEAMNHIPIFLADLDQAYYASKSIRDSFSSAIDALPYGVLKSELKYLRKQGGIENCLNLGQQISGREVKSLVAGISVLFATGNPRSAQLLELNKRIRSICAGAKERLGRYEIVAKIAAICFFFCAVVWTYLIFQADLLGSIEIALLPQFGAFVLVGFLMEQVVGN